MTFSLVIAKLKLCATLYTYKLECIAGEGHEHRSVLFLISADERINAKVGFDSLTQKTKRIFQTKFDYWLSGKPYFRGFHKWDKSEFQGRYTNCLVFTSKEDRSAERLYGFLRNPKLVDPSYHVCVLVRYASKHRNETHERNLKIVEETRTTPSVQKAVYDHFKEMS